MWPKPETYSKDEDVRIIEERHRNWNSAQPTANGRTLEGSDVRGGGPGRGGMGEETEA